MRCDPVHIVQRCRVITWKHCCSTLMSPNKQHWWPLIWRRDQCRAVQSSRVAMTGNGPGEAIDLALRSIQVLILHSFCGWFGTLLLRWVPMEPRSKSTCARYYLWIAVDHKLLMILGEGGWYCRRPWDNFGLWLQTLMLLILSHYLLSASLL